VLAALGCSREAAPGLSEDTTDHESPRAALAPTLHLTPEEQLHMGLGFAPAEELAFAPEARAYGRVLHDPGAATTLRAPLAGTLRAAEVVPELGTAVAEGEVLFRLEPRWSVQETADLEARRVTARSELATIEAELPGLRSAVERAKLLNAKDRSVSDREVEEAESRAAVAEARAAGMRDLLERLDGVAGGETIPLASPRSGELVALLAHAGEAVEAGATLLTVEDFTSPLVAVDLPLDGSVPTSVTTGHLARSGGDGEGVSLRRSGIAPEAGNAGLATTVLFRAEFGDLGETPLRPGLEIVAQLPTGESLRPGLRIPRSAVVRVAGQGYAYVRVGPETFERMAIPLDRPIVGGWFFEPPGAESEAPELVVRGAQSLLSFELLGRQGGGEE
jgi:multidrug efflux pump subunit AcrA (membrane-fusion protein)